MKLINLLISSVIATSSVVLAAEPICPSGWYSYDGSHRCFIHQKLVSYEIKSFDIVNIFRRCEQIGGVAASLHNAFENTYVRSIPLQGQRIAIGTVWTKDNGFTNFDGTPVEYRAPLASPLNTSCVITVNDNLSWDCIPWTDKIPLQFVFCTTPPAPVCKSGFVRGNTKSTSPYCYHVGFHASWNDARYLCKSMGAELADVKDSSENAFLTGMTSTHINNLPAEEHVWLGGTKVAGNWVWDDFSSMSYKNFGSNGGSTSLSQACIAMAADNGTQAIGASNGKWFPYDCSKSQRAYICKMKANI